MERIPSTDRVAAVPARTAAAAVQTMLRIPLQGLAEAVVAAEIQMQVAPAMVPAVQVAAVMAAAVVVVVVVEMVALRLVGREAWVGIAA